ncbi:MAG: hypothetical protein RLZZ458_3405 [Planctomycetota bacterium]
MVPRVFSHPFRQIGAPWLLMLATACFLVPGAACVALAAPAPAIPPETKKELGELAKELKEVPGLIKKKEVDKAKELIAKADARVKELAIAEDEKDRSWTSFRTTLEKARYVLPVSFESEVTPVLRTNCIRCHSEAQASGNLRLDTYAAIARGGRSGQVVMPRVPNRSLLALRLIHTDENLRMPKEAAKLKDPEILTVVRWIEQGAAFDGESMDAPIGDSLVVKKPPVKVVMATGTETVSFKKDVAPWMVNICIGCHSGNNPRGDYKFTTFEELLQGGPTGNTIVPGKPDESYIVDLVLRQEPLKMPAGQAQLKLSQAKALETWIREGARYDGGDPKAPLRSIVPTDEEIEAAKLAAMSDADFEQRRIEQADSIWKRVSPRSTGVSVTTANFHLHGSVDEARLKELGESAEAHLTALRGKYPLPGNAAAFRGRLVLFIAKDRFDYEEFNTVLMNNRRTPKAVSGHSVINANFETAYVAMHDVGDTASDTALAAPQLLNSLISQTYLTRDGSALPEWLRQGFGLTEAGLDGNSDYIKAIPARAAKAMSTITDPAKLFTDGTFAPDEVTDVGYLLVRFLIGQGGMQRFQQFTAELRKSPDVAKALQTVYSSTAAQLGQAFVAAGAR